jgi:hypothetical protein
MISVVTSTVTRFQLGMPKARKWKAFADANGIVSVGPSPGDHKIWTFGKQKFHVNRHRDELDLASVKAAIIVSSKQTSLKFLFSPIEQSWQWDSQGL